MSLTRNLDKAKQAYLSKDAQASINAHSSQPQKNVELHQHSGQYIKSAIYGGLDGTITTFAVVAGSAGAALGGNVVLILGFANLVGDGISMAVGDYLSTKAEQEYHSAERKREAWEMKTYPQGEKLEMVEIYASKGYSRKDAETIVDIMSKNEDAFVDTMMVEELGILQSDESPLRNALVTLSSFIVFGFIPLLAFVLAIWFGLFINSFLVAAILTTLTLFVLGAIKTRITGKNWIYSGLEMLLVGGLAAAAAYGIGAIVSGFV